MATLDDSGVSLRKKGVLFLIGSVALAIAALVGGYYFGRSTKAGKVVWLSDLTALGGSNRRYFFQVEVKCPAGNSLGIVAADLNLKNGRLAIVRNDPGENPKCDPAPPAAMPAPQPPHPATPAELEKEKKSKGKSKP